MRTLIMTDGRTKEEEGGREGMLKVFVELRK